MPILEDQKPENKVKPKYYCDMCSVQAIDENQLKQHLNGARHFKALKAKTSTVVPAPGKFLQFLEYYNILIRYSNNIFHFYYFLRDLNGKIGF